MRLVRRSAVNQRESRAGVAKKGSGIHMSFRSPFPLIAAFYFKFGKSK